MLPPCLDRHILVWSIRFKITMKEEENQQCEIQQNFKIHSLAWDYDKTWADKTAEHTTIDVWNAPRERSGI